MLFSVCSEYFLFDIDIEPDFEKATFTVPKEWLLDTIMKSEQSSMEEAVNFLEEEYTSDDSIHWYESAIKAKKIMVFFVIDSSIFNTETIKNN